MREAVQQNTNIVTVPRGERNHADRQATPIIGAGRKGTDSLCLLVFAI